MHMLRQVVGIVFAEVSAANGNRLVVVTEGGGEAGRVRIIEVGFCVKHPEIKPAKMMNRTTWFTASKRPTITSLNKWPLTRRSSAISANLFADDH